MCTPGPARRLAALGVVVALAGVAACGGNDGGSSEGTETARPTGRAQVVVTFSVLGAVVQQVAGDVADVRVLMPDGIDPHDWEPSARDVEAIQDADLVVANGLGLEESIEDVLAEAEAAGVVVFEASDHIDVRQVGEGEAAGHDEAEGPEEEGHGLGVGSDDPHLWMDPLAMASVVEALGPVLAGVGADVGDRAAAVGADLEALNREVEAVLAPIPPAARRLVTGHESLGYFADRYGFDLVGAVVPSLTSQAEASAGEIAALREAIEAAGVGTIFTEIGTSAGVADAIADETGAEVVELGTHNLPDDGTYRTFMLDIANTVATALAG